VSTKLYVGIGVVVAAIITVIALAVIPSGNYDVTINVTSQEISLVVANYFSISGVQPAGSSPAAILDLNAFGFSFGPPALNAQFEMTVCLTNSVASHCTSKSANQWFPTVPFINGATLTATNSFIVPSVPPGQYSIGVTLYQSGSSVASGSGSVTVPGG
jgi:hypothetical protein